ncbi:MAG: PaaI family thioesterase [Methanoregulaceae archaeon]|jgi:acyl-CoA thioesterase|nr:PaaI family thioesterase [Methanoregulaceae archaeon]
MADHDGPPDKMREMIALFNTCEFARLLGMEIVEARPGFARVLMDGRGTSNPNKVIHGGAIFALADQAFGIAGNLDAVPRVAVSASIMYLSPAIGPLEAVAERVGDDGQYSLYHARVYEGRRLVATFEGIGVKTPRTIS